MTAPQRQTLWEPPVDGVPVLTTVDSASRHPTVRPYIASADIAPRMAFALAIIRYRRPIEDVVANTDDHRAYLRALQERGTLIASGPFDPRFGGALLLNLPDDGAQEALDAVRDGDPFWQRGIAQYELLRWNPVIGKDALDALVVKR